MTYTTNKSASGYNSVTEQLLMLPTIAQELYRQTVKETDGYAILSAITSNSLFGETEFYKDARKIIVTREATSFPARQYERNQTLIPDSISPEQFTVCAGKKAYKLLKFDRYTLQDVATNPSAAKWFMDVMEKVVTNVVRETYLPDVVAGMRLESSPKTKGTLAGGINAKYNLGTIAQPRIIKRTSPIAGDDSYLRFVMDLEFVMRALKTFSANEMFMLGGHQITSELTLMAAQGVVPTTIMDSPIFSLAGSEIGKKMAGFDYYHDVIMDPFFNVSGQLVYPIIFGSKNAYAFGSATEEFIAGTDNDDLTSTAKYARAFFAYGGRIMNDEAIGVAYITFQS